MALDPKRVRICRLNLTALANINEQTFKRSRRANRDADIAPSPIDRKKLVVLDMKARSNACEACGS
jgi:hypothetical protein